MQVFGGAQSSKSFVKGAIAAIDSLKSFLFFGEKLVGNLELA